MNNIDMNPESLMQDIQTAKSLLQNFYTAESGIAYPEELPPDDTARVKLDVSKLPIEVYVEDIEKLPNEEFALIRRDGFGGSDSSILLGINPFTKLEELIAQKASKTLTEEEKAVGNLTAVIKGNDLEPLIIDKFEETFRMKTIKPTDMYVFKEWPFLKMNFDGVTGTPDQYLPVEIKVVTKRGERHYDPFKAIYIEREGYRRLPERYSDANNAYTTKATQYGIPAYYYTQLQQEMMALNAPFGYLCTLWESTWKIHIYLIHKDQAVWNALKIEGFKAWQKVLALEEKNAQTNISQVPSSGVITYMEDTSGGLD